MIVGTSVISTPPKLITAPVNDAITVGEVKDWMNFSSSAKDTKIGIIQQGIIKRVQEFLNRQFITATYEVYHENWQTYFELPLPPAQAVTSIKYEDTASVEQTMSTSDYQVNANVEPGIVWITGDVPDLVDEEFNRITIRYTCGYGLTASTIPEGIRNGMLEWAVFVFENQGDKDMKMPGFIAEILRPYMFDRHV